MTSLILQKRDIKMNKPPMLPPKKPFGPSSLKSVGVGGGQKKNRKFTTEEITWTQDRIGAFQSKFRFLNLYIVFMHQILLVHNQG